MSEIDYERLAKAAFTQEIDNGISDEISEAWGSGRGWHGVFKEEVARAVVAAYREQLADQGLVVLRRDDAERARRWHTDAEWAGATDQDDQDARDRISAALAANPKE